MVEAVTLIVQTEGPQGIQGVPGGSITTTPPNIYREYDAEQSTPNNATFAEFLAPSAFTTWPGSGTWTIDILVKFDVHRSAGTSGDVGFYVGSSSTAAGGPTSIFSITVQDTVDRTFVRRVRASGLSGATTYYTALYFRALGGGNTQYMRGVTIALLNAFRTA